MNNQPLDILDIYDISYNPWYLQKWFMYSALGVSVVGIIIISYLLYKKHKKEIVFSPQEKALQQLTDLKNKKLKSHKEFYISLTAILKQYLQGQYHVDVIGATDAEFLHKITDCGLLSEPLIDDFKTILDGVTFIKFANESAAKEQMQEALKLSFKIIKT